MVCFVPKVLSASRGDEFRHIQALARLVELEQREGHVRALESPQDPPQQDDGRAVRLLWSKPAGRSEVTREEPYGPHDAPVCTRRVVEQCGRAPQRPLGRWQASALLLLYELERAAKSADQGADLGDTHRTGHPGTVGIEDAEKLETPFRLLRTKIDSRLREKASNEPERSHVPADCRQPLATAHNPPPLVQNEDACRPAAHDGVGLPTRQFDDLDAIGSKTWHPDAGPLDGKSSDRMRRTGSHAPPYPIDRAGYNTADCG